MNKFGSLVKELRMKNLQMTLREFCLKFGHDPSNWSKIERGKLTPPRDKAILESWAQQLGLTKSSSEWFLFFDYASIEKGSIPEDILSDKELVGLLPVFFRTVRGQKPSKEEMKKLSDVLRRA